MSDFLENLNFSSYPVEVHLVLDFALLKDFDGDFLLRDSLDA